MRPAGSSRLLDQGRVVHGLKLTRTISYLEVNPVLPSNLKRQSGTGVERQRYSNSLREQARAKPFNARTNKGDFPHLPGQQHHNLCKILAGAKISGRIDYQE